MASRLSRLIYSISRASSVRNTQVVQIASLTRQSSPLPSYSRAMSSESKTEKSIEGIHEWKTRAPYAIHTDGKDFPALYNGSCHCGKVTYQVSRDKPLSSKYCHCTTCQTLHGTAPSCPLKTHVTADHPPRRSLSMGRYLPQGGHQFHKGAPRSRLV